MATEDLQKPIPSDQKEVKLNEKYMPEAVVYVYFQICRHVEFLLINDQLDCCCDENCVL